MTTFFIYTFYIQFYIISINNEYINVNHYFSKMLSLTKEQMLTFYFDQIYQNKMKIYFEENKYTSYLKFVLSYVKKAHFAPILIQVFIMNFTKEYLMRYSQMRLYAINDEKNENELFYILLFIAVSLTHNVYRRYKDTFDVKNRRMIEHIFEKDIFIQKAKIPFYMRQKINMDKLNDLRDEVSNDLVDVINNYFESFVNIFTNIILSVKIFYENKMIHHYIIMCITLYFVMTRYIYPMKKRNIKLREESIKKRKVIENQLDLLNFNFIPFIENTHIYDLSCEKTIEIYNIFLHMKNMNKDLLAIMHYLADFFMIVIFLTNYTQKIRNYYIILTTITSLFSICKDLLNNTVNIEESIEKYDEFQTYFKDIPNDDAYIYASKIEYPLTMAINVNIYDQYTLHGSIHLDQNEFVFITGESGSGKSTLAKKIAGYDYYIQNEVIYRKCVYYLTQDYNESWTNNNYTWNQLFPNMKNMDELKSYLSYFAFPTQKINDSDSIDSEIPVLSGGEKKRLQYAFLFNRDLKECHQLIILDEPHKDLDEQTALKMISGIQKLIQEMYFSKSLIIIKHEKPSNPLFSSWKEWNVNKNGTISIC